MSMDPANGFAKGLCSIAECSWLRTLHVVLYSKTKKEKLLVAIFVVLFVKKWGFSF